MSRRLKALLGSSVTVLALALAVTGSGAPTSTRIAYIGTDAIYLSNIDGSGRELIVRGVEDHTTSRGRPMADSWPSPVATSAQRRSSSSTSTAAASNS